MSLVLVVQEKNINSVTVNLANRDALVLIKSGYEKLGERNDSRKKYSV